MDVTFELESFDNQPSEKFTTTFNQPIELESQYMYYIGLESLTMENSWHNISERFKNNLIILENNENKDKKEIKFRDGNYTLTDINNFIAESFNIFDYDYKKLPFVFGVDNPTSKCVLHINDKDSKVNFEKSNFHELLGFEKRIYALTNRNIYAEEKANISNGVDRIYINCSIAEGAYYKNTKINEFIYSFATKNKPGSQIIIKELNPRYFKVLANSGNILREIQMKITDQNFKLINLNQSKVHYTLILKKVKK